MKQALKDLIPIIGIFCIVFYLGAYMGDYDFYLELNQPESYPPFTYYALNLLNLIMPREIAIFILMLLTVIIIPYFLINSITKERMAGFVYLYGSQIPLILGFVWFIPQSIIHIFMLLFYRYTWFGAIFILMGWTIHDYWYLAFIFTLAYKIYRWYIGLDKTVR